MIRVHHLNNSRSQRILWLLEELGLPYEIVKYQRDAVTNLAPPELEAVHPLGKSPMLELDGEILIESGAIRPVIHASFPLDQASEAHRLMESSAHVGKLVLQVAATA